jgi:hypothetical protein
MAELPFHSGKLSNDAYRQRCQEATARQLALLTSDPAFGAWQLNKAARENRTRAATNLLAVAGCVLLVMTMALLKPVGNKQVRNHSVATATPLGHRAIPQCLQHRNAELGV